MGRDGITSGCAALIFVLSIVLAIADMRCVRKEIKDDDAARPAADTTHVAMSDWDDDPWSDDSLYDSISGYLAWDEDDFREFMKNDSITGSFQVYRGNDSSFHLIASCPKLHGLRAKTTTAYKAIRGRLRPCHDCVKKAEYIVSYFSDNFVKVDEPHELSGYYTNEELIELFDITLDDFDLSDIIEYAEHAESK